MSSPNTSGLKPEASDGLEELRLHGKLREEVLPGGKIESEGQEEMERRYR